MSASTSNNGVIRWIEHRLPIFSFIDHSVGSGYPAPRNLNYWWNFGSLAGLVLVIMIVTGIVLAMQYTPHVDYAFDSVERIMRDVNAGWLIRYIHMNGGSFFFIVVFIHIFRGLYYGSYKAPRELLWMLGVLILLLMMATAFMGYVLPWGQMSFWGATVITNFFTAIPIVGDAVTTWLWGGPTVDNPTLNRFFSLHYLLPFVILGVVVLHIWALHVHGSNNPMGIDLKGPQDKIPFHPYYTVKDLFGLGVFLIIFSIFVFFAPNFLGHPDNYIPADPLVTPEHIVPEWYFLPFYAILRAVTFDFLWIVPAKLGGVILMFGSILILFVLPWLDRSPVRSATYRPYYKWFFWILVLDCIVLGWVGANSPDAMVGGVIKFVWIGQVGTFWYFFHFIILLPLLSVLERPKPVPTSIGKPVLQGGGAAAAVLLAVGLTLGAAPGQAKAAGAEPVPSQEWSHSGIFGTFDRAALQRGFQVYNEVCAVCHSLRLIAYRNLADLGYSPDQIKAFASQAIVVDGPDDEGEMFERPGRPSDRFPPPFPNDKAAAAANAGALPPDLTLMAKARFGGADYIYALLTGYEDPPADVEMQEGLSYNRYFPGNQIAMAPPLFEDSVEYADGTEASISQMSHDLASFLAWTAEPEMEVRKRTGIKVILFLIVLTAMLYAIKRRIWADVGH